MSDKADDEEHDGLHERHERCRAISSGPQQLSIIEYTLGIVFWTFDDGPLRSCTRVTLHSLADAKSVPKFAPRIYRPFLVSAVSA